MRVPADSKGMRDDLRIALSPVGEINDEASKISDIKRFDVIGESREYETFEAREYRRDRGRNEWK